MILSIFKTLIHFILLRISLTTTTTASYYSFDLSSATLDPAITGFRIDGIVNDDFVGSAVGAADIDNDGYDDMIIGASGPNSHTGAVYVIYGEETSSFANINLATTTLDPLATGFTITGSAMGDNLGYSVGTAGDFNKDGYEDFVIGAQGQSSSKGAAYVIYGGPRTSMANINLATTILDPLTTGFKITGNTAGDSIGLPVRCAGDINQDGYSDIIVGASDRGSNKGAVYVIYGRSKSSAMNIDLSSVTLDPVTTGFMITGNAANDYFGFAASTAGDVDNDGYADIVVGAYMKGSNKGAAYVIYGGPKSSAVNIDLGSVTLNPTSTGFMITGAAVGDYLGFSVGTAGDMNKDGYDDIIVGIYGKSSYTGAACVIYGRPKSSMVNIDFGYATLDPLTTGFMITGAVAGDKLGVVVGKAGDMNKDGYSDIVVSAYYKNSYQGAVYVIYGGEKSTAANINLGTTTLDPLTNGFTITGPATPEYFGRSLSTGDINNDGNPDLMIGANRRSSSKGAAYIIYAACSQCWDCSNECLICDDSPDECTQCSSPSLLSASTCVDADSCPTGTFPSTSICQECNAGCSSCASGASCSGCAAGYTLVGSACVSLSSAGLSSSSSGDSASSQKTQDKAYQGITSSARGIGSVVCVGSSTFSLTALVSKIVQNTRYLNLTVTNELAQLYQTWDTDLINWDVPNVLSKFNDFKTSPMVFSQYGLGSPFLENFWPTLVTVGIGLGIFVTCLVLRKLCDRAGYKGWIYSVIQKLLAGSFNFSLVQTYGCLDDILFYLVLDSRTNPFNTFFCWASLIGAVLFMVGGCLLVLFNLWTVNQYQKVKKEALAKKDMKELEAFNEKNKYWELFYSDFNDSDAWSQSFFAMILIRSTITSFIITVLYEYPLMQSVYFIILDEAVLLFLYFKSPFTKLIGKLAQYYFEVITLLVHFCTFVLGLQDTFDKPSDTLRDILSTAIIYLNTALVGGSLGFMFIEVYETIKFKTKAKGKKFKQKKNEEETSVIQLVDEENQGEAEISTLATSPARNVQRRNRRLESTQQINNTSISVINMENSFVLETNYNFDNSMVSDVNTTSHNMQRDQSILPMAVVRSPTRIRRQQPLRKIKSVPKKNIRIVR